MEQQVNNPLIPILQKEGMTPEQIAPIMGVVKTYLEKVQEWDKLATIEVKDHTDVEAIKQAGENRLKIKRERVEGEKFCKAQRARIQEEMAPLKMEDTAYLRIIQYFDEVGKAKEEILKEKEDILARYQQEQLRLLVEGRTKVLSALEVDASRYPLAQLDNEAFEDLVAGIKAKKKQEEEARIQAEKEAEEARLEADRIEREKEIKKETFAKRREEMSPYFSLSYEGKGTITLETSEEDYQIVLANAKVAHEQHKIEEQKKLVLENKKKEMFALGFAFDGKDFSFGSGRLTISSEVFEQESFKPQSLQGTVDDLKKQIDKEIADKKAKEDKEKADALARQKQDEENRKALEKERTLNSRLQTLSAYKGFYNEEITVDTTEEKFQQILSQAETKHLESIPVDLISWVRKFELISPPQTFSAQDKTKVSEIQTKFDSFKKWAEKLCKEMKQ